ncbi:hypothetical protein VaNZ11_015003 [Volvox africanus]|uniref:PDZ domain-containing protein n=1 Tax=Volvox africanus TaxID=51714 RepID=A0ABQ5SKL0_9CHLO|nr:hypothetical protein VaNZ11_015003 [Volvox africanus]
MNCTAMEVFSQNLFSGKPRRSVTIRQAALAPSWLRHRLSSRWSCEGSRRASAAPFGRRVVANAISRRLDSQNEGCPGDKDSGAGGSEGASSLSSSPAAPSWLPARQWMGRAACCAAATAVALSLIASADCSAAAAAAATVAAATTPPLAATAATQPGTALLVRQAVHVRMNDSISQDSTKREAVIARAGYDNLTWLRQPKPQSPAVLVARGLTLVAQPIAEPGASGAGIAANASWYESVYDKPAMATRQALADVTGAATGASAPSRPASSESEYGTGRSAEVPRWVSQAPSALSPPMLQFTLQSGRTAPAARVDGLLGSGGGEGSGGERRLAGQLTTDPGVVGDGARVLASTSTSTSTSAAELGSETEDRLLEVARQVEARVEGVLGALTGGVPQLLTGSETQQDASTSAAHALIREVWEVVDSYYLDARATGFDRQRWAELRDGALAVPYRDTAAGYRAVRDILARGLSDPYCRFIGPPELEAMKKYDVSGVGLNLGTASEYVVKTGNPLPELRGERGPGGGIFVVGVSKGSIADIAGVRQGDELLEIQGQSLDDSTPFRAAGLISGSAEATSSSPSSSLSSSSSSLSSTSSSSAPSSPDGPSSSSSGSAGNNGRQRRQKGVSSEDLVRIKVLHASGNEEELSLVRPRRTLPSAVSTSLTRSAVLLPGGIRGEELVGTVRLASFNARAQADVAAAIRQLESAGATRLVLDLRDNRGGLVTEGLEVARLFLGGDAPIVITERRDAPPDTPRAPGPTFTSAPLLVLVNGHTASASEIVAGALHDNCRAVLAGSRTYGKGLIQSVYELSDGSGLVVTVGKYLTPRGTDIDRYGIKPDFNSVPSGTQYDSTIKACKLAASVLAATVEIAPPVFGSGDMVSSTSSITLAAGNGVGWW